MNNENNAGISLLQILITIAVMMIAVILLLPAFGRARSSARYTTCGQHLGQVHAAMMMYQTDNNATFPTRAAKGKDPYSDGDSQEALGLLYQEYTDDIRIFSCPSKPIDEARIRRVLPSSDPQWLGSSFKESTPGVEGNATSYGYSPGHNPKSNSRIVLLADRRGTGPKGNSDNHGIDMGQEVMTVSGAVEWQHYKSNELGKDESGNKIIDTDIFAKDPILQKSHPDWDSVCR